jgi:hypothetical protein
MYQAVIYRFNCAAVAGAYWRFFDPKSVEILVERALTSAQPCKLDCVLSVGDSYYICSMWPLCMSFLLVRIIASLFCFHNVSQSLTRDLVDNVATDALR